MFFPFVFFLCVRFFAFFCLFCVHSVFFCVVCFWCPLNRPRLDRAALDLKPWEHKKNQKNEIKENEEKKPTPDLKTFRRFKKSKT